jgi:response regulator of citrate/malate metabolism
VVQAAVSFGAMQYLVKPFTFAAVRQKLERYQAYRAMLAENNLLLAQQEVDRLMHTLRDTAAEDLPKGISSESLQAVVAALRQSGAGGLSAAQVATTAGASRVTARRYLEYLVMSGVAVRSARYRSAGRPEVEYRLVPRNHHGHPAS